MSNHREVKMSLRHCRIFLPRQAVTFVISILNIQAETEGAKLMLSGVSELHTFIAVQFITLENNISKETEPKMKINLEKYDVAMHRQIPLQR